MSEPSEKDLEVAARWLSYEAKGLAGLLASAREEGFQAGYKQGGAEASELCTPKLDQWDAGSVTRPKPKVLRVSREMWVSVVALETHPYVTVDTYHFVRNLGLSTLKAMRRQGLLPKKGRGKK